VASIVSLQHSSAGAPSPPSLYPLFYIVNATPKDPPVRGRSQRPASPFGAVGRGTRSGASHHAGHTLRGRGANAANVHAETDYHGNGRRPARRFIAHGDATPRRRLSEAAPCAPAHVPMIGEEDGHMSSAGEIAERVSIASLSRAVAAESTGERRRGRLKTVSAAHRRLSKKFKRAAAWP